MTFSEIISIIVAATAVVAMVLAGISLAYQLRGIVKSEKQQVSDRFISAEKRLNEVEGTVDTLKSTIEAQLKSISEDIKFIKNKVF